MLQYYVENSSLAQTRRRLPKNIEGGSPTHKLTFTFFTIAKMSCMYSVKWTAVVNPAINGKVLYTGNGKANRGDPNIVQHLTTWQALPSQRLLSSTSDPVTTRMGDCMSADR